MPTLSFQVPRSDWARLEENARREGVSVRSLVLWQIKTANDLLTEPLKPDKVAVEPAA